MYSRLFLIFRHCCFFVIVESSFLFLSQLRFTILLCASILGFWSSSSYQLTIEWYESCVHLTRVTIAMTNPVLKYTTIPSKALLFFSCHSSISLVLISIIVPPVTHSFRCVGIHNSPFRLGPAGLIRLNNFWSTWIIFIRNDFLSPPSGWSKIVLFRFPIDY